jgi:hypothetical protein
VLPDAVQYDEAGACHFGWNNAVSCCIRDKLKVVKESCRYDARNYYLTGVGVQVGLEVLLWSRVQFGDSRVPVKFSVSTLIRPPAIASYLGRYAAPSFAFSESQPNSGLVP